jgi:hypothetical protein
VPTICDQSQTENDSITDNISCKIEIKSPDLRARVKLRQRPEK